MQPPGLHIVLDLWANRIAQPLGMFLGPAKALAQEELPLAEGNLGLARNGKWGVCAYCAVAHDPPGLPPPDQPEHHQRSTCTIGHTRWHHQSPGGQHRDRSSGKSHPHGPEFNRRTQQGLDRMPAHCSMPREVINMG